MLSVEQALLNAIWAEPHDDAARLVYADWLEETGQPTNVARAEFIRVQCALERADDPDERRQLRTRETRILKSKRQAFIKGLPGGIRTAAFSRGFPYPCIGVRGFHQAIQDGRAGKSPLWQLNVFESPRGFGELLRRPELLRVGRLIFAADLDFWIPSIVHCKYALNFSRMDLCGTSHGTGDRYLRSVAESPNLLSVEYIAWSGVKLSEMGIREFCHGPLGNRLRGLELNQIGLTPRMLGILSESPVRENLRQLSIREPTLGNKVVEYLVCKDWFLHKFSIGQSGLSDAGYLRLGNWPGLANIETLNLGTSVASWESIRAFAASPYLNCSPDCTVIVPANVPGSEWEQVATRMGPRTTLVSMAGFGGDLPTGD